MAREWQDEKFRVPRLIDSDFCVTCLEPVLPRHTALTCLLNGNNYSPVKLDRLRRKLNYLTIDHLFPRYVCRLHPRAFEGIVDSDDNLAPICWREHKTVDKGKLRAFRSKKILPVIDEVAKYKRSPDPDILEVQRCQFIRLFAALHENLRVSKGEISPHLKPDYDQTKDRLEWLLTEWRDGNFDVLLITQSKAVKMF